MVGPSGMDTPAPSAPSMVDDTFRVISALSQGDPIRAESIMVCMPVEEFAGLRRLARTLESLTATEADARSRAALLARVTADMPPCTCPPDSVQHADDCPRRVGIGPAAPFADGLLPRWQPPKPRPLPVTGGEPFMVDGRPVVEDDGRFD